MIQTSTSLTKDTGDGGLSPYSGLRQKETQLTLTHNPVDPRPELPDMALPMSNGIDRGFIDMNGNFAVSPTLPSENLDHLMADTDLEYVSAAEHFIGQGNVYRNVEGFFIAKDGTAIIDSVIATADGFDIQGLKPNPSLGFGPMASILHIIPPRTDFVAVFSRSPGILLIVGSKFDGGGDTNEIWAVPQGEEER